MTITWLQTPFSHAEHVARLHGSVVILEMCEA